MWVLCRSWASSGVGGGEFPLNLKSGVNQSEMCLGRETERERQRKGERERERERKREREMLLQNEAMGPYS